LKGDLRDVSFDDVEAVRAMEDGSELPLSKTLILERKRGRIGRRSDRLPLSATFSLLWDGRGELPVPEAGRKYQGRFAGASAARDFLAAIMSGKESRKKSIGDNDAGCVLDVSKIVFPLLVRNRRPTDRYHPLGAPGGKKLKEILRAKGVPEDERGIHPVFVSGNEIVWVQGLPASENHKVTARTKKILRISAVPARTDSEKRKRS
jgi:tRNA(Ile)-lysidine synthase